MDTITRIEHPSQKGDFTPSTDVWFSDGSVVLVAQTTAFRVHGSIMAAQCDVFKDMFAIPQPAEPDSEKYEGCQVLRLQDSATDLWHFLKSIYKFKHFRPGAKTKFPVVAAVLKLSTKYQASELRQRAVDLLITIYPSTLAAWDMRSTNRLVPPFEGEFGACVAIAIRGDIRVILPGVYYAASRLPLSEALGQLRGLSDELGLHAWDISTEFLVGCERLERAELKSILPFLSPLYLRPGCQRVAQDNENLAVLAKNVSRKVVVADAYHQWCSENPGEVGKSIGMCEPCCQLMANSIQEGRQNIWEELPGFFGLANWETLKARDEMADSD